MREHNQQERRSARRAKRENRDPAFRDGCAVVVATAQASLDQARGARKLINSKVDSVSFSFETGRDFRCVNRLSVFGNIIENKNSTLINEFIYIYNIILLYISLITRQRRIHFLFSITIYCIQNVGIIEVDFERSKNFKKRICVYIIVYIFVYI